MTHDVLASRQVALFSISDEIMAESPACANTGGYRSHKQR